jgi:hypothetical protein
MCVVEIYFMLYILDTTRKGRILTAMSISQTNPLLSTLEHYFHNLADPLFVLLNFLEIV